MCESVEQGQDSVDLGGSQGADQSEILISPKIHFVEESQASP